MFGLLFQSEVVDRIEYYVNQSEDYVAEGEANIEEARLYQPWYSKVTIFTESLSVKLILFFLFANNRTLTTELFNLLEQ